jgi:hypothetical protein
MPSVDKANPQWASHRPRSTDSLEPPLNPARIPDRCRRSPTGAFVQQSVARLPVATFLLLENHESTSFFRSFLCGMLHFDDLPASEVEEREGYRLTCPIRTIVDVSNQREVSGESLSTAFTDGQGPRSRHRAGYRAISRQASRLSPH